jgi:preprotein translocase subunit SecA
MPRQERHDSVSLATVARAGAEPVAAPDLARQAPRESRGGEGVAHTVRRTAPKVGRNDPCPCGSGKKYKKCCGLGAEQA